MADDAPGALSGTNLASSFLTGGNAAFVEDLYARYLADPSSVPGSWQAYFKSMNDGPTAAKSAGRKPSWAKAYVPQGDQGERVAVLDGNWAALEPKIAKKVEQRAAATASVEDIMKATRDSVRALMMIRAFRMRGHLGANLDPLGIEKPSHQPELDPSTYGFTDGDWDHPIFLDHVLGLEYATLRQIYDIVRRTYCGNLGIEFMHISDPDEKSWLQERMEGVDKEISFTPEGKKAIYKKITEAETFERFVHRRYPGTKRFGLDGGEALIPALEQIIKRGGNLGLEEIVLGMPHRGRLNVLAAVMGKPYHIIFHEFSGGSSTPDEIMGSGDVKYHLGASSDRTFDEHKVHLSLTPNPSHLEIVNPVVLGRVRAKQVTGKHMALDRDEQMRRVMPVLLHGDAAFAGQGVVAECFALSGLRGYRTGGCIHLIVNNQIGFTTSPKFSRSSPYPSDVALMVQAPIFHVNGDDPEAVVHAAKVATEYRQKFLKDVVIDIFCYRRFGHNEGDDPSFTQPIMYKKIKDQVPVRALYAQRLNAEGLMSAAETDKAVTDFETFLDQEFDAGKNYKANKADWLEGEWSGLGLPKDEDRRGETAVKMDRLKAVGLKMTEIPAKYDIHKTLERVIKGRREAIEAGKGIDWATAEHLAFGTLLDEGVPVRLSGQDCGRGTFSQRHSHLIDQTTEERYTFLNNLREGQAHFEVIDSLLSEEAVLGFDYGFSLAAPHSLVLWEAQFGDFANGAQVIVDQFMSSAERKWLRMSGLVMLLPHGYEGQGPEHSSARLERYLQMCAEDNMQVANCSTPANYFHILRRQMRRDFRKPLIMMTPKSLLRHKRCVSTLADFAEGSSFHRVLEDDAELKNGLTTTELVADADVKRVLICSGKVYYDLVEEREKRGLNNIYILRLEQFYPFPIKTMVKMLERFKTADMVWVQEEPRNMGPWPFVEPNLEFALEKAHCDRKRPRYCGRNASASTATGLMSKHNAELRAFLDDAFTL